MKKIVSIIAIVAVFALIIVAIAASSINQVDVGGEIWNKAMVMGDPDTAIRHYVVYTDLMCPYCNYYGRVIWQNDDEFQQYIADNKIAYEVRVTDMLYESSGVSMSRPAAEGAYCAAREDRFWDYYHASLDHIFNDYYLKGIGYSKTAPGITDMNRDYWYNIGKEIGLGDTFKTCFKDSLAVAEIEENTYNASYEANGLPSFTFGKFSTSGFDPSWDWDTVKPILNQGLK